MRHVPRADHLRPPLQSSGIHDRRASVVEAEVPSITRHR